MDARTNQQAVDQDLPTKPSRFDRSDGADFALVEHNSSVCRFKMFFVDSLLDDLVE
jgi:hypothetical protein